MARRDGSGHTMHADTSGVYVSASSQLRNLHSSYRETVTRVLDEGIHTPGMPRRTSCMLCVPLTVVCVCCGGCAGGGLARDAVRFCGR